MSVRSEAVVTLVELMIAVAILSIAVLGLLAVFGGVQKGIQMAKNKSLAANLAQEKMQIIEQQSYFRVAPTLSPSFLSDGTAYDTNTFPPENVLEGGVSFTRYTDVQVVNENSGVITVLPATTPDTGMRQITVMVTWLERGSTHKLSINSVMANPNTVETNSVFTGTVKDGTTNSPISGATVNVAENVGWSDTTLAGGAYTIRLSPGTFNLVASAKGYFSKYAYLTIGPNNSVTQDFSLTAMSSGTVKGTVWMNTGLVISQVVGATTTVTGCCGQKDVEYVELFNPTTSQINLAPGVGAGVLGNFKLNTQVGSASHADLMSAAGAVYVSSYAAPGGYFLIASYPSFVVNGAWVSADAYYNSSMTAPDDVANHSCGSVQLADASGSTIDQVCWNGDSCGGVTLNCNGTMIPTDSSCGLNTGLSAPGCQSAPWLGDQLVRYALPSTLARGTDGSAYDSGSNAVDFIYPVSGSAGTLGLNYSPFVSTSPALPVVAGIPAVGAVVTGTDGLSSAASAVSVGSPPTAQFTLPNVATGTWTVLITSGAYEVENDVVAIPTSGSQFIFPAPTILTGSASTGFITGAVVDALGNPISAPSAITVSAAGQSATASGATGRYLLRVAPGTTVVTANGTFSNASYVSASSSAVSVGLGQVTSGVNFVLSQGGRLMGWVTRDGVNGLQGMTMTATDVNGNVQDQEITDVNGYFKTVNLATGAYTVNIPLDSTETSTPTFAAATASIGQTVFVASFTITGALGTIQGSVTSNGSSIASGVLVVVTTSTLPSGPPALSSGSLTMASYYAASSKEDGTYSIDVRQSTSPAYNVYGYYTTINSAGAVTTTAKSLSNVQVVAGQMVTGKDLAW